MGCACTSKKPTVTALSPHKGSIIKSFKKNKFIMGNNIERVCDHPTPINNNNNTNRKYFNNISYKTTCIIFNFLNFKELKEIGKCNSFCKRISANPNILKKFFKKNIQNSPCYSHRKGSTCCTNQSGNKKLPDIKILIEKLIEFPTFNNNQNNASMMLDEHNEVLSINNNFLSISVNSRDLNASHVTPKFKT